MATKAPKKKESREQVNSISKEATTTSTTVTADERLATKKKIPLWPEWSDQDIANEKWDNGKNQKDRGRSPTAALSCFEDPEGKIGLPSSLKARVHTWKRPCELFNDKNPVVVNADFVYETCIDLVTPNEHITDSELIRHIISTFTSLYQIFGLSNEPEAVSSIIKIKPSVSKDAKDANARMEKTKKDTEYFDEMGWKPWYQIWPKEGSKGQNVPSYNQSGKYAVKIFWMGCYRKIIVDDTIPCDESLKPLLPLTTRGNEIWVLILTKALIKVASLDYYGGLPNSEIGDSNIIHCLTGWLPESIPIEPKNSNKIWNLLLNILPHWTLSQPIKKIDDCNIERRKSQIVEEAVMSKVELLPKESKDKGKKDEKGKDDKRVKTSEKIDRENRGNKEKPATPICTKKEIPTPDYILFATFLNPPSGQYKISDLKEMANISQKLRQFGLCQYLSHPVYLNSIRICPLFPPPEPLQIPRWKLIRQKKNRELVEPKCCHQQEEKEPKFLELKSALFNFNVNSASNSSIVSPTKPEKQKPAIQIASISEEGHLEVNARPNHDKNVTMEAASPNQSNVESNAPNAEIEISKKVNRSLSTSSQGSQGLNPKIAKVAKSKQDVRKSAQKDKGNIEKNQSRNVAVLDILPSDEVEVTDSADANPVILTDALNENLEKDKENEIDLWMDFDDFLQCFSTLWIYHKPKTNLKSISDIKGFDQKSDKPRKSAGTNAHAGHNLTSPASGIFGGISADLSPPFLLVDCINEVEVAILFSSFSRWLDANIDLVRKEENNGALRKALLPIPGTLIVEPYFWKRIVTASPLLRISTTGLKAAVITLPPGRHVLRFMINTPLGYHICISSSQSFVFDDEHVVMQHLTKDSSRFVTHGMDVLKQLKLISQSFGDKSVPRSCKFVIGTENQPGDIRVKHFEALNKSITAVLKSDLEDNFHPAMKFALNALKYESYFHIKKITTKHRTIRSKSANDIFTQPMPDISEGRSSLPTIILPSSSSSLEEAAATKLQSTFKGFYTRKLMMAYVSGSLENNVVVEMLTKIWNYIDANNEEFATKLYHKLFNENPNLYRLLPFHTDELNKVTYSDYNGSYSEPPNPSWFLIFREIFYVMESNLILPKFYCNISNCHLKIINNDTAEELETLFSKIVPQVMHKNKHGYTFLATACNQNNYVPSGKFRLRIIGEKDILPIPVKEATVNTHFLMKEIRDYYIPNRYNRIFRHSVKVTEDVISSIQFYTSKGDVYTKLQILDNDQVIYSCEGKRCLVIPALIFYKDRFPTTDNPSSRPSSQTGSVGSLPKNPKQSRRTSSPDKHKRKSVQLNDINFEEEEILEEQIHKYVIEGFVLRDSWPLTRKEWTFVKNQKNNEKLDKEASSDSVVKTETSTRANSGKSRKTNAGKDSRLNRSRPPSQTQMTFDVTKANWMLRFIIDANMESVVEIKRDTQRDEEIKAIKSAWETVEPGRATKAQLSRQKYLDSHTIHANDVEIKEEESMDEDGVTKETYLEEATITNEAVTSTESPQPSEPDTGELFLEAPMKENLPILITFDTTPYIRSTGKTVILDQYEEEKRQSTLQDKFANFHLMREMLLQMRENNRIARNLEKEKQLAEYEKMQIKLDEARSELYKARDLYRNKFIQQPEVVSEPEMEKKKRTPSPKSKSSKTKAKKK